MARTREESVYSKINSGLVHIYEGIHIIENSIRFNARSLGVSVPDVKYINHAANEIKEYSVKIDDVLKKWIKRKEEWTKQTEPQKTESSRSR